MCMCAPLPQLEGARAEMKDLREKYLKAMQDQHAALEAADKAEQRASAAEIKLREEQVRQAWSEALLDSALPSAAVWRCCRQGSTPHRGCSIHAWSKVLCARNVKAVCFWLLQGLQVRVRDTQPPGDRGLIALSLPAVR